jgi:hypothetical protein
MAKAARSLLRQLTRLKDQYGGDYARRKENLLQLLERRRLSSAKEVLGFHEILCFLRAYPDDREVLAVVERLLSGFADRSDLRRFRKDLTDSGIAGTPINFSFFWFTAIWLARRWPKQISVNWSDFENSRKLVDLLHLLLPYSETPALDDLEYPAHEWIAQLKKEDETDAEFIIRRFRALKGTSFARETFYENLDIPIRIEPGPRTPARTHAKYRRLPVVFQRKPLDHSRPSMRGAMHRPPLAIRSIPPREAQRLINLAREAMVTRSRDLDSFMHADKHDVRLVDCGDGLQFVCMGAVPERRLLLESVYGFLTLKNGVPIGYVLTSSLFNSTAVAYNVFETYRGGESALIYGRILGMIRAIFGSDAISIDPFQLGHNNMEGLKSGAWWFYYKLGFRPHDSDVRRVMRRELARMKRNPRHRSSLDMLTELTASDMFLYHGKSRRDIIGHIALGNIGLQIVKYRARRFGWDCERAVKVCSREATKLLGVSRSRHRGFSAGEKLAWERWSPLILTLPGIRRWSPASKRALAEIVRAKGGRRESDFVLLFDKHRPLRRAILKLAAAE